MHHVANGNAGPDATRIAPGEWGGAAAASAALAVIAFLPHAVGYLAAPPDLFFLGYVLNAKDQNTYFMWMTQIARGDWFARNLYSTVPHDGAMLNLYFVVITLPAQLFGVSLDVCYQAGRLLASFSLGVCAYAFAALFFRPGAWRWLAWASVIFTAGLGWLPKTLGLLRGTVGEDVSEAAMIALPIDTWVPEGFPWYAMVVMPHFTMALSVLLLTLRWLALALVWNNRNAAVLAGVSLFALSFVHPYDVIVCYALAGTLTALLTAAERRIDAARWAKLCLIYAVATPPIVYNYVILNRNPGMKAWLEQNISDSPPPMSYLLGFGIPLFLSIPWLIGFLRRRPDWASPWGLIAVWIALAPFMLYAPLAFQRRLVIGMSAPLAVALVAWCAARPWPERARLLVSLALIGAASLTSAFHLANGFRRALDHRGENFLARYHVDAMRALPPGAGSVLSGFLTGNAIPRFTGRPVVIGSRGQTGNFDEVLAKVGAFYSGTMPADDAAAFLAEHRVEYIYYGPEEQALDAAGELPSRLGAQGWERAVELPGGKGSVFRRGGPAA